MEGVGAEEEEAYYIPGVLPVITDLNQVSTF